MLNKQTGNMYDFVTHTWNTIKGKCSHDCKYCYMKKWGSLKNVRFDEKELKTDLGSDNFIFVGSSNDICSPGIAREWVNKTINHCFMYDNTYLFQSKNPGMFLDFRLPPKSIIGTTIESNREYYMSEAPNVELRSFAFRNLKLLAYNYKTMITIEPIMDFDLPEMIGLIEYAEPDWVNIGANTSNVELSEPSYDKILELIERLKKFTDVREKRNLKRLEGIK